MTQCLFCRIVKKEIPGRIVYEDEAVVAFEDINPQAPVHILVVPRKHVDSLMNLTQGDKELMGSLFMVANELAKTHDLNPSGFRAVINTGPGGGQTVYHLHVHLMGGRQMTWPPG
ncbi:MAG TPA: histidine triad nucleotide-binding protein [Nitrospiria bacterium]|nr:histidine triad nucleotide-binding protein [Nitrospiria bacterium]